MFQGCATGGLLFHPAMASRSLRAPGVSPPTARVQALPHPRRGLAPAHANHGDGQWGSSRRLRASSCTTPPWTQMKRRSEGGFGASKWGGMRVAPLQFNLGPDRNYGEHFDKAKEAQIKRSTHGTFRRTRKTTYRKHSSTGRGRVDNDRSVHKGRGGDKVLPG